MNEFIEIRNHGPLITESNYWDSEAAQAGYLYLSINAGAFRLMIPDAYRSAVQEMRPGAKSVVISILPSDQWVEGRYVLEWMVEDGSSDPWSCHLSAGQVDRIPRQEDADRSWIATAWNRKKGRPHKCLERPAYLRVVPQLPCLKRWGEE